jgi:hypothetical protein
LDFIEPWLDDLNKEEPRSLGVCESDAWEKLSSEVKSDLKGTGKWNLN